MGQTTGNKQYVEFGIGEENFAIQISEVYEIIRIQHITDIPGCRGYVEGVINLRGKIVPVVSLRSLIGITSGEYTKATRIVVLQHTEEAVGIIVDRVNQVATFSDIQPPPEQIGGLSGSFFTGIGITAKGLIGILSLDELLIRE